MMNLYCYKFIYLFTCKNQKRSNKKLMRKPLMQQNQVFQIYNPFMNPPNIKKAYQHQQASRVGIEDIDDSQTNLCYCCGDPIQKKQIPLNCNEDELLFLGPGYPIFFKLSRYFGWIVLATFILSGSAFYLLNTLNCQSKCIYFFNVPIINLDTIGNRFGYKSDVFHFLIAVIVLLLSIFIKRRIESDIYNLESKIKSPEQYTIIVQNLPQQVTEQQISDWSKQKLGVRPIIINFAYNISQLSDAYHQRLFFTVKLNRLKIRKNQAFINKQSNVNLMLDQQINDVNDKLAKYDRIILHYKRQYINHRKIGTVFLTYPSSSMTENILNKYQTNFFHTLLNGSLTSFKDKSLSYQGFPVVIRRAPAPRQIIWENLAFSYTRYIITQLLGIVTMVLVLFIAFKIQLKLTMWSFRAQSDQSNKDQPELFYVLQSLFISLMILLVNLLLRYLIQFFINLKKHYSYSRYQASFCFYYSLMYIFNTCFMIYIVHIRHQPNPQKKQLSIRQRNHILVYDIHLLILLSAFSQPIYKIIDPVMWIRIFWRRHIESMPPQRNPYTQAYVNSLWEQYSISNVDNYQYIFRMLVVSIWFSQAAPLGVLISLLGLFCDYWITKYLLLRMYKKPQNISKRIAVPMIKSLLFLPLVYLCGVLQFTYKVSDSQSIFIFLFNFLDYVVVVVIIILTKIGYQFLGKPLPPKQDQASNYGTDEIKFGANYDTQNPMVKIKDQIKYASNYTALKRSTLRNNPNNLLKQLTTLNKKSKSQRQYYPPQQMKKKTKLRKLQTMEIQLTQKMKQQQKSFNKHSYRKSSSSSSDFDDK